MNQRLVQVRVIVITRLCNVGADFLKCDQYCALLFLHQGSVYFSTGEFVSRGHTYGKKLTTKVLDSQRNDFLILCRQANAGACGERGTSC